MSTTQNLFREYIAWRARAVVYVAAALAVLGLFGLGVLIATSPDNVNRFGLLLEGIGVFSVIPHIVGKNRFRWLFEPRVIINQPVMDPVIDQPPEDGDGAGADVDPAAPAGSADGPQPAGVESTAAAPGEAPPEALPRVDRFALYTAENQPFMLGNIFAAAGLTWLLAGIILNPHPPVFPAEISLRVALSLVAFAWLNAFMLVLIYRLFRNPEPESLLALFFAADLLVGFVGIFFGGIIFILEKWLGGGLRFTFRNGVRRVLLMATLPFVLAGLGFQLLATFLP